VTRAMRRVSVVGIGAGDPDDITIAAIKALNASDVFFVIDKPGARADLVALRRVILERYVDGAARRTVLVRDPERDRGADAYAEAVEDWRRRRADVWETLIAEELRDGERGAFLVWGDPALYDSTIAVLDDVAARAGVAFELDVVAGISCVASLTARHAIALNRVGEPVQITTGRRLAQGFPADADDVVVMLDAGCAFASVPDPGDVDIYWGAYLGTEDEILVAGRLADVADEIVRVRGEARERKGWIMDTYLLRRSPPRRQPGAS
jgi:precorrin-6A synthase